MVSFINESVAVELAPSRSSKAPRTPEGIKQRKYRLLAILANFGTQSEYAVFGPFHSVP
jgi:hypothetical protein